MGERVPCLRKCGGCVYSVVKKNRILNEISLLGWVSWNNNKKKILRFSRRRLIASTLEDMLLKKTLFMMRVKEQ